MEKIVQDVKCNVHNCVYNENSSICKAGHIEIGTCDACSCSETLCSTFQPSKENKG